MRATGEIGYIGLGKMGLGMVERLLKKGNRVTAFDLNPAILSSARAGGVKTAESQDKLIGALAPPRLIWIMVPYTAVDSVLDRLLVRLVPGDTVIDGGNSPYKQTMRRAASLQEKGIHFLDAGVSGGPVGARDGACIMIGGKKEQFERHEALFRDLSVPGGYAYVGRAGAGHFVKMVHNGIEYGMMQALAEGFAVMNASPFELDPAAVADLYDHGSVIESRLVTWLRAAYREHGRNLNRISGSVSQSGEGLWTVEAAEELGVDIPIIEGSVEFRFNSQKHPSYAGKILSALRNQFGGHTVENSVPEEKAKVRRIA